MSIFKYKLLIIIFIITSLISYSFNYQGYDNHMIQNLKYRVPEYLWDMYILCSTAPASDMIDKSSLIPILDNKMVTIKEQSGIISNNNDNEEVINIIDFANNSNNTISAIVSSRIDSNTDNIDTLLNVEKGMNVIDLGVGTGLTGRVFREGLSQKGIKVEEFMGCDLSSEMIIRAYDMSFSTYNINNERVKSSRVIEKVNDDSNQDVNFLEEEVPVVVVPINNDEVVGVHQVVEDKVYTSLAVDECISYLTSVYDSSIRLSINPTRIDIVLAGDVLVYFGDLIELFSSVSRILKNDTGIFLFSVEKLNENIQDDKWILSSSDVGYKLLPSARFAHSKEYILKLALNSGFRVLGVKEEVIREDGNNPIVGYIFAMKKMI